MNSRNRRFAFILPCCLLLTGCAREEWDRFWQNFKKDDANQPNPSPRMGPRSKGLQGAIGPLVTIEGVQLLSVRGYGLVVDLVDTGGADGPQEVKNYLVKEVRRRQEIGMPGIPAGQLFEGRGASMVELTGLIPAAAKKGDRFDVVVRALGSQTKSLVGGRLVLGELKLFADTPQGVIEGKALASATGPVFITIFDREGQATDSIDLRQGYVLGGGVVKEPRRVRFVLNDPRYSIAQQMVARINGRYAGLDPLAEGQSASAIDITIPEEYRLRKRLFLERIAHTVLNDNPALLEKRAQELKDELSGPDPEYETIGLAWEAIGKICLPKIREAYQHAQPDARYYAARTGLRLGDTTGLDEVVKFALDIDGKFRLTAIDELGFAVNLYGAGEALRKLLDDEDDDVRIRAYRALRRRPHPAIQTRILDTDNLILDCIESAGEYLVYVQRLHEPRIAVFGRQLRCKDNAIFPGERRDARKLLTQITANPGDKTLTVLYHNKRTNRLSDPLPVSFNVCDMIGFLGGAPTRDLNGDMEGLAVPYSELVDILHALCKAGSIPARFRVEDLKEGEDAEVDETREREESEF